MKSKILLLPVMALLLSGCLKEKNESYTTLDNYFQTAAQIETGLNGCYNSLRTIYQHRGYWQMTEIAADLMYMSSSTQYDANCDVSPARPGAASTVWQYGYIGVKNTNEMTYAISKAVENGYITEEAAAPLYAEAAVLRAMYYYILTSTFGDVPFYAEPVTEENRQKIATLPRMDANQTRDYCIEELYDLIVVQKALPMIRTYEGTGYRAGAAVGLMVAAKMCLWNERWEDAIMFIDELENIYGHYADPAKVKDFGVDYPLTDVPFSQKYVKESIFEMANVVEAYGLQTSSMIAACCMPSRVSEAAIESARNAKAAKDTEDAGNNAGNEEDGESTEDTSGSDCYAGIFIPELGGSARTSTAARPTTYLYSRLLPYYSKDLRSAEYTSDKDTTRRGGSGTLAWIWEGYDAVNDPNRENQQIMFFYSDTSLKSQLSFTKRPWMGNKFWAYGMSDTKDPNNYKIFRFADALLMKAEAYLNMGDYANASAYLNITRTRAGLTDLTYEGAGSESDSFMEEIRKERARELVGEFQRKYDLVRWGIWYERTLEHNENSYIKGFIRPCHRYWPIPADQVAYSGYALDNNEYLE